MDMYSFQPNEMVDQKAAFASKPAPTG